MNAGVNPWLRILLLLWVVGYLFVSCSGIFNGDLVGAGIGLFAGAVLLVPWLIGVIVLGILVWVTNPRRLP